MIGQHPLAYGLPELNLFMAASVQQFWEGIDEDGSRKAPHWPVMRHGLQRTVAQLYAGEQTVETIQMAYWWIMRRKSMTTGDLYRELCEKISPLMVVEKSPGYLIKPVYLQRLKDTFPDARFIHLARHPIGTGQSILSTPGGKLVLTMSRSVDEVDGRTFVDPQFLWYDAHIQILEFLDEIPRENSMRIRGEEFLRDMDQVLAQVCDWLGLPCGAVELESMRHPERSPYACIGPVNARLGNDVNFLERPAIRPARVKDYDMGAELPWRPDKRPLFEEVVELAQELGYR